MRLDVPKFNGANPKRWIFSIIKYFALLNTPVDQWMTVVRFNLEGVAAEWFRWMTRNGLITDWDRFVESVKSRFGSSKYEDPQGALLKLLQLEQIVKKKTDAIVPLQSEVASPKIKGSLNVDEDIGDDEVSSAINYVFYLGESNVESMEVRSMFGEFLDNKKSVEEVVGGGEALVVGEDDDSGNATTDEGDDAVKSEDISILNSLIGHGSPRSSQLLNDKYIKKKKMEAAIQRRLWDPGIKIIFLDITLRTRWF
nr:retrotransposon protein [Tanacetum cinerariifolium]